MNRRTQRVVIAVVALLAMLGFVLGLVSSLHFGK